jgi:DNA-binding LacI/PurR family transcriptional regulator
VFFEMKTPINPNAFKRRAAYVAAMERLSHDPHLIQVDGEGWDFEDIGFTEGSRVISEHKLPTNTVLCSNDRLAIGLLSAAFESGMRVGQGAGSALRIAGHDDHPFSRFTCPRLTTISQDYAAIASRSVKAILSRIEKGERAKTREVTLFDGRLVMRGSA